MTRFRITTVVSILQLSALVALLIYLAPLLGMIVVGLQSLAGNSHISQSNMTVAYEVMDKSPVPAHSE